MIDDGEAAEEPVEEISTQDSIANARKASTDAYGHLIRATADICSPRYHYYCGDEDAELPEKLVIVANTRRVPIRDNELLRIGSAEGVLEAQEVKEKGSKQVQFVVAADAKGKALRSWRADVREDLRTIQKVCPEANYICLPEFGFPYGIEQFQTLEVPANDADWSWLQESTVLNSRFVCLGSAHRRYRLTKGSKFVRYENVAVVYPAGKTSSRRAADVFVAKRNSLEGVDQVKGVTIKPHVEDGLTIQFDDTEISATRRSDLSAPATRTIDKTLVAYAKEAVDFFDTTAQASEPPVYIRKKSPARKLGEYIDASGKFELDVFVTKLGVIAALICYDAFDPSIFLSAVRMYYASRFGKGGFVHQAIDVFVIPAFNKSGKFVEMCKVLSRETNSVVIYVSGDNRCETKSNVFVCGQECKTWAQSMGGGKSVETYYSLQHVPGFEHLHIHRINKEVVRAAMRHARVHASPSVRDQQLFGGNRLGADRL